MPVPTVPLGLLPAKDLFGEEHFLRAPPNLDYWGGVPRQVISGASLFPRRNAVVNDHITYINVMALRSLRITNILSQAEVGLHLHRGEIAESYQLAQTRLEVGAATGMLMHHLQRLRHDEEIFTETYQAGLRQAHKFWMLFRHEDMAPLNFHVKRITRIEIALKACPSFLWQADDLVCQGTKDNLRELWRLEPDATKDLIKTFVNLNAWTRPCISPWDLSKEFLDQYLFTEGYPWDWPSSSSSSDESDEDNEMETDDDEHVEEARELPNGFPETPM